MNGRIAENVIIKMFVMNGVIKMGMSIDEAIGLLERGSQYNYYDSAEDFCKAYDMSIEIMRKYKKICKILDKSDNGEQCMYDTIQEIEEVRDGDDD